MKNKYILLSMCFASSGFFAQSTLQIVDNYLKTAVSNKTLKVKNQNILKSQIYYDVINENTVGNNVGDYVKIQQKVNNIPVYGTYGTFQIRNKQVLHFNNNFTAEDAPSSVPSLTVEQAAEKMASSLGKKSLKLNSIGEYETTLKKGKISQTDVVKFSSEKTLLNYIQTKDGLKLGWIFLASIDEDKNNNHIPLYEVIVDANTGELLSKTSIVNECSFDPKAAQSNVYHNDSKEYEWIYKEYANITNKPPFTSGSYRVIPASFESPLQHDFTLLSNVADPVASQEGWHKVIPVYRDPDAPALTPYHTIGNNAHVSADLTGEASDLILTQALMTSHVSQFLKNEAYGGTNLAFDFPTPGNSTNYDPLAYHDASTTQMFYSINSIHDILYYHGFNPKAGSFQANTGEGKHVTGITLGGLGEKKQTNNAFMVYNPTFNIYPTTVFFQFETLPEGAGVLQIKDGALANIYQGVSGNNTVFDYTNDPKVTGDIVLLDDGSGVNPHDGCENPVLNANTFTNKIVMVDRGNCNFLVKINNIRNHNPKGIIIVNNSPEPFAGLISVVDANANNDDLKYPIIGIEQTIGNQLKDAIANNTAPAVTLPSDNYAMTHRDSGFDSQVILHEYTHAVSGRLTDSKMNGEEGMNEGWSDYAALNLTQQASQTGADEVNMGNYSFGGVGMRPKPYTTDMSINPHTYDYLKEIGAGEKKQHPTGYLWALMLWEMHWKFVDKYGFNPDHKSNSGGNNMALDLVLQGQKMQVPDPGFVEGRDGILQADELLFNGQNKCMIWEAFAKRGLGYSAQQGLSASRIDGTQAFDLPAGCEAALGTENVHVKTTEISIFPNPAKDVVYVMAKENVVKAEIFDSTGRLVSTQTLNATEQRKGISTSSLPKGVYILKLYTTESVVTKKIIKN